MCRIKQMECGVIVYDYRDVRMKQHLLLLKMPNYRLRVYCILVLYVCKTRTLIRHQPPYNNYSSSLAYNN
jgi:hypothetical protein